MNSTSFKTSLPCITNQPEHIDVSLRLDVGFLVFEATQNADKSKLLLSLPDKVGPAVLRTHYVDTESTSPENLNEYSSSATNSAPVPQNKKLIHIHTRTHTHKKKKNACFRSLQLLRESVEVLILFVVFVTTRRKVALLARSLLVFFLD